MRALLCYVLSFSLIFSSVSPAAAQVVQAGRAAALAARQASQAAVRQSGQAAARQAMRSAASPALYKTIEQQTLRQLVHSQVQPQMSALPQGWIKNTRLSSFSAQNGLQGAVAKIFQAPAAQKAALLRNEFVLLSLARQTSTAQLEEALQFYRRDLMKNVPALKRVSGQDTSSLLDDSTAEAQLEACRNAFSSAGALGLLGTPKDAQALIRFHEAAAGGPYEQAATYLTARGLLRQQAYEAFNDWARTLKQEDPFWTALTIYAKRHALPVELQARLGAAPAPEPELAAWLEKGNLANGLNASGSLENTEKWMALGRATTPANTAAQRAVTPQVMLAQVKPALPRDLRVQTQEIPARVPDVTPKKVPSGVRVAGGSGNLYSGVMVPVLAKPFEKAYERLRVLREEKKKAHAAQAEEPGLHENTVRPVFGPAQVPAAPEAEDMLAAAEAPALTEFADTGFKLTMEDETGTEKILHNVEVTIDSTIKTAGYNRMALSKNYIFELRNLTHAALQPSRFFFKLANQQGEFYQLLSAIPNIDMHRPLRVKLEHKPNVRYQAHRLPVFNLHTGRAFYVNAQVDKSLLPKKLTKGRLLVAENGEVWVEDGVSGQRSLLKDFYIRLPKEDSKYWVRLMQTSPQTPFALSVHSTANKTKLLTMAIPGQQIGLGKTLAPELRSRSELGESASSMVMLGINNVLPVMMGLVHPLLKRYGEAKVLRWGQGLFLAGGATALASGLYGHLGSGLMTGAQLGGFITSSVLIALGTNITRFVQNNLISANRGKVAVANSFKEKTVAAAVGPAEQVQYDLKFLAKRTKEVFTAVPGAVRDVVLLQTASMFKNIGTMGFLAFPWLANTLSKTVFGADLGLDFSASYVPYALFSAWTAYKLGRTAYKDAFPMDLATVENNFKEVLSQTTLSLADLPVSSLQAGGAEVTAAAKQLKNAIDALTRVEVRSSKIAASKLTLQYEAQSVQALQQQLEMRGATPDAAQAASQVLQKAFDALDHRDVSVLKVMKSPKLTPALIGMTLATVHELSVSNGFAFAMHGILGNGAQANAFTALALYGSMSIGRILGNMISRRISGGSMYALSSAFSIVGTTLMASAGSHIAPLITGAVIASFGVGNFFAQMYEYMVGLYPKFKREIALLINYTMPLAAVLSFPMRWLVQTTGVHSIDLWLCEAALLGSIGLTPGMLANSSVLKVGKNLWNKWVQRIKQKFSRRNLPPQNPGSAAGEPLEDAVPVH